MSNPTRGQFSELRHFVDGNDGFMRGCKVMGNPQAAHHNRLSRAHQKDAWAFDNKTVRELLLRIFPKMHSDINQRAQAGRWSRIIHAFFREGITANRIALRTVEEKFRRGVVVSLDRETKIVEDTVRRIRRAASGLRTTGKPRSARGRGRPKKSISSSNQ